MTILRMYVVIYANMSMVAKFVAVEELDRRMSYLKGEMI